MHMLEQSGLALDVALAREDAFNFVLRCSRKTLACIGSLYSNAAASHFLAG